MNKQLAKVTKATLQIQERDILMFYVFVDYEEGTSQGIGGICLDTYDKDKKKRVGTAYGCEMIKACLDFFGVNNLSEVKNYKCYLLTEKDFIRNAGDVLGLKQLPFYEYDGNLQEIIKADVLKEFTIE